MFTIFFQLSFSISFILLASIFQNKHLFELEIIKIITTNQYCSIIVPWTIFFSLYLFLLKSILFSCLLNFKRMYLTFNRNEAQLYYINKFIIILIILYIYIHEYIIILSKTATLLWNIIFTIIQFIFTWHCYLCLLISICKFHSFLNCEHAFTRHHPVFKHDLRKPGINLCITESFMSSRPNLEKTFWISKS